MAGMSERLAEAEQHIINEYAKRGLATFDHEGNETGFLADRLRELKEAFACPKHGQPDRETCIHCAEDAKLLEDRVKAVAGLLIPSWEDHPKHAMLVEALRDLIREARR